MDELQRHYIAGRLTSEELGERVTQALSAKTFGDLSNLLGDLPTQADPVATESPSDLEAYDQSDWHAQIIGPSIGMIVLLIGLVVMLMVFAMPGMRFAFFPWPLLIWGFFFLGRPFRGGRRRF